MTNTHAMTRRYAKGNLFSQFSGVILRPVTFFGNLPPLSATRQWLWMAVVIVAGMGAVQFSVNTDPARSTVDTWSMVLVLVAGQVAVWFLLTCLLALVSMFNGQRPRFGVNLQIAVWSFAPFVLMAGLQLFYIATGGAIHSAGLSRLIIHLPAYTEANLTTQQIMLAFASNLTIFGLWQVVLLMVGARQALQGKRSVIVLVALIWVVLMTALPVITGTVREPQDVPASGAPGGFPGDFPPEGFPGELPPGEFFDDFPPMMDEF